MGKKQNHNTLPPKLALRFLSWYCTERRLEEIEGDLEELFYRDINTLGERRAKLRFWINVIRCFKPYAFKRKVRPIKDFLSMDLYINYLITSVRRMKRERSYSVIAISALTLGLLSFMLIATYLINEYKFDTFYPKKDRIYRVVQIEEHPGGVEHMAMTSIHLAEAIRNEIPGVAEAATVWPGVDGWVEANGKTFYESDYILASENFFQIFDQQFLMGSDKDPLKTPMSAVITESLAIKYFGTIDIIGEIMNVDRYGLYTITAVIKDLPGYTHMPFDMVLKPYFNRFFENVHPVFIPWFNSWEGHPCATMVLVDEDKPMEELEATLQTILPKYKGNEWEVRPYYLQNIAQVHLNETPVRFNVARVPQGDKSKIYTLTVIAVFLLVIAIINYTNLSSARMTNKLKEIGVRRCVGARRWEIFRQVMTESLLITFMSGVLALVLFFLALPHFGFLVEKELTINMQVLINLSLVIVPVLVLTGLLSGAYPAFMEMKASEQLVTWLSVRKNDHKGFRNVLVTAQFMLAMIMIVLTMIINHQNQFVNQKELGFSKETTLVMEINGGGVRQNYDHLKAALLAHPAISEVSGLSTMVGGFREPSEIDYITDGGDPEHPFVGSFYGFDEFSLSVLDLDLVAGRDFSGNPIADSTSFLINESLAKNVYPDRRMEEIIGETIRINEPDELEGTIIGIVKDFHFLSLHEKISPLVIGYITNPISGIDDIAMKFDPYYDYLELYTYIDDLHKKYEPTAQMTLNLLDDLLQVRYRADRSYQRIFMTGSFIVMFIALLGIVGLSAYSAQQRSKEFGIRKVMGASILQILSLQAGSIIKLIIIGELIAVPVILWWGRSWLENFSYKISISPYLFVFGAILLVIIGIVSVNLVTYRIARLNPANTLRDE
ncbi:permease prefix domain 2-containing transporter [Fulvivirgaceae bacterium BMA10]|uniref:Permease prefix domain 2-containing transporter n=1 Tax=Splendidivirga corallicola TaxID=3051826 RepID=A0ABT8KXS9_9BACT|nr:permease prefix domain 2-containing transporter [Fulvivirgaceae bacterium BMA10]